MVFSWLQRGTTGYSKLLLEKVKIEVSHVWPLASDVRLFVGGCYFCTCMMDGDCLFLLRCCRITSVVHGDWAGWICKLEWE